MKPRTVAAVAALLSLALVLAACGDDNDEPTASPSAASAPEPTDELPPEGRGIVTEHEDGTRTVESTYGTATVPADPERIISVIGDVDFEAMLALGVTPVGAGTQGGNIESGFAPHLGARTDGVEPLAWADGAPVEAIARLEPDLIFVPNQDTADLLDDIAPVVPRGTWVGTEWKEDFLYVGEVLGLADEAQEMIDEHESRAADLRDRLAPVIEGMTVLSPQVAFDHTQVYIDADDAFSSAVLTELGFTLDDVAERDDSEGIAVSFERFEEIDADILFWQVRQADDGSTDTEGLDAARANPLFERLPAVSAGRYFEVPNRPWYFPTILGATQILDDVEAALLRASS
ncbi:MAG TPA: iron-siderophore ABC transporter substrate-binding protein [Acidimicrobiales bacterium]|nr:iron-siderophore ABC transporter substrate-binding protein [Acidimicrobiales bacterium]